MRIYSSHIVDGNVEALLLIGAVEAAAFDLAEAAAEDAIRSFEFEQKLAPLQFVRIMDLDKQDDGAIMLHFEAAEKPSVTLGQYRGIKTGIPRNDTERFTSAALDKATANASVKIPGLLVERRLDAMRLQRRSDVLGSVKYATLSDLYMILRSLNEGLAVPLSPDSIWEAAMWATQELSREDAQKTVERLLAVLGEALSQSGEKLAPHIIGQAVETRLKQRENMDAEQAADELFLTYLRMRGQSEEQWRDEQRPLAEELVRTELVLDAVAEKEGLQVSRDELDEMTGALCAQYKLTRDELLFQIDEQALVYQLLRSKAAAVILDSAME